MDTAFTKTIGLAVITALLTVFVARADGSPTSGEAGGVLAADSASLHRDSTITPKWLDDGNVLAIVGIMNARQIAAANLELSSWHSDTVRALAASLLHEHSELQHSADSLAERLHVAPLASALTAEVGNAFQAQTDSLTGVRGLAFDRAYVRQQLGSHTLMANYFEQLAGVASNQELQAWLQSAGARTSSQISRLQGQLAQFAVADSLAADSLARRAAMRRKR